MSETVAILYKLPAMMNKALMKVNLAKFKALSLQAKLILDEAEAIEREIMDKSKRGDTQKMDSILD
jgi:hypothetical protein